MLGTLARRTPAVLRAAREMSSTTGTARAAVLERCRTFAVNRDGYNGFLLPSLTVQDASPAGKVVCEFVVGEHHANRHGTLHGGVTSSLVDVVSTLALVARLENSSGGVSVDLSVTFLSAARAGEKLRIESTCHKAGRTLAFTNTEIFSGTLTEVHVYGPIH
ncbi:acyl-coenzyme A thioesterase 13-like protein [Cladochytrium replicatum]|nr:acyl-coenzyme A thioesterase 13-like protein [Cladochytrium replicatum]